MACRDFFYLHQNSSNSGFRVEANIKAVLRHRLVCPLILSLELRIAIHKITSFTAHTTIDLCVKPSKSSMLLVPFFKLFKKRFMLDGIDRTADNLLLSLFDETNLKRKEVDF